VTPPKPAFLGPEHGAAWQDRDVAAAYHARPPYPDEVFGLLGRVLVDEPRVVLDLGCGTGVIARQMAPMVERIDAVDISAAMIAEGSQATGGDHPAIRWIVGRAEDAALDPPYGLIVAASSLHWMDWDVVLPRLGQSLTPRGVLVIVGEGQAPPPWQDALLTIIRKHSVNRASRPGFDLPSELAARGLLDLQGRCKTSPVPFRQPLDAYVESFHARSGLTRAGLGRERAEQFDSEVRQLVSQHCGSDVELRLVSDVAWGRPAA
jgi:SAM-dependent methyltransferase